MSSLPTGTVAFLFTGKRSARQKAPRLFFAIPLLEEQTKGCSMPAGNTWSAWRKR
jgi:hypothetical protein